MFLRFEFHGFEGAMSITSENVDEREEKVSIGKNRKRISEAADVTVDDGDLADMNKNKKKDTRFIFKRKIHCINFFRLCLYVY